MALPHSWQHQAWLSITAGSSQPPASKVSKHTTHFLHPLPIYWALKDNRSVSSQLMKSSLNLSFRYHDLYQAKPNPDKLFKSKHESNGLHHMDCIFLIQQLYGRQRSSALYRYWLGPLIQLVLSFSIFCFLLCYPRKTAIWEPAAAVRSKLDRGMSLGREISRSTLKNITCSGICIEIYHLKVYSGNSCF